MRTHTLPLALFALSVSAVQLPVSGNLSPGPIFIDSKDFEALGRHPNNTRTVTFNQTSNSTAGEWLWRINITDTAIPNRIVDGTSNSGNYSEGFHVVNTQYQFIWPGASNESLQTYLADRRMNVVMEGFVSRRPSNVTDAFDLDDHSGSCAAVLGEQCVQTMTDRFFDSHGSFAPSRTPECQDTLLVPSLKGSEDTGSTFRKYQISQGKFVTNVLYIGEGLDSGGGSMYRGTYRNETLWYHTSRAYREGNDTELVNARSALHILAVTFRYWDPPHESGPEKTFLLCQMIQKSADNVVQSDAAEWRGSMLAVWVMVLLSVVSSMW
jgi:hypothetical protein